jgi:hypothetical protein
MHIKKVVIIGGCGFIGYNLLNVLITARDCGVKKVVYFVKDAVNANILASERGEGVFNISKAKNELGYKPEYDLEEGLKETIEYFSRHL